MKCIVYKHLIEKHRKAVFVRSWVVYLIYIICDVLKPYRGAMEDMVTSRLAPLVRRLLHWRASRAFKVSG